MKADTAEYDRHRVGSVAEFELDRFRVFEIERKPVGVVRTERGFFAVRNRCPHQAAAICSGRVTGTMLPSKPHEYRYDNETRVVICPWHRWEFDLADGASVGPVTNKRLVTYEVEVDGDEVFVKMRARRKRQQGRAAEAAGQAAR